MHELGIACDLVEIVEKSARSANAVGVTVVHLKLGVFAGVMKEALLFGYDSAVRGTLLEGSRLEIEDVALVVFCPACDQAHPLASIQSFQCPVCDAPVSDIRQGQELEITAVEIIEHANETA